jgi:hypothetical protein
MSLWHVPPLATGLQELPSSRRSGASAAKSEKTVGTQRPLRCVGVNHHMHDWQPLAYPFVKRMRCLSIIVTVGRGLIPYSTVE